MDVDTFLETVRRYTDATTITKRMVAELIQYIEVYPAVKEDGVTNQRVTIHYNCIGAFEVPDRRKIPERDILLETRKGVAFAFPCGKTYGHLICISYMKKYLRFLTPFNTVFRVLDGK